jgi:prepilin-type processing-associated H-X9-DG protein
MGEPMRPAPANAELASDYIYRGGLQDDDRSAQVVAADRDPALHNGGANYLYLDAHVKWLSENQRTGGRKTERLDEMARLRGEEPAEDEPADGMPEPGMEEVE